MAEAPFSPWSGGGGGGGVPASLPASPARGACTLRSFGGIRQRPIAASNNGSVRGAVHRRRGQLPAASSRFSWPLASMSFLAAALRSANRMAASSSRSASFSACFQNFASSMPGT
jgi:hypothetical protein